MKSNLLSKPKLSILIPLVPLLGIYLTTLDLGLLQGASPDTKTDLIQLFVFAAVTTSFFSHFLTKKRQTELNNKNQQLLAMLEQFAIPFETDAQGIILKVDVDETAARQQQSRIRSLELQLERLNRELESIANIASHDLQSPIRHISAFIDMLAQKLGPNLDDESRKWMDTL